MDVTSELTIVIPVRIDCQEREENLHAVLHSLLRSTSASILIIEADTEQRYFLKEQNDRLNYIFIHDNNQIFHRTRYLNKLLNLSKTNIVGIWDSDVIIKTAQIREAVNAVKNGVTLCYPYDGRFLFLNPEQSICIKNDTVSFLRDENSDKIKAYRMGRPSVGGAFVVAKQRYLKAGGENENFYGWGPEDAERYKRMEILNEAVGRVQGPFFHLYHPRGINSTFGYDERDKNNLRELIKVCRMNKIQLKKYIDTWTWGKIVNKIILLIKCI